MSKELIQSPSGRDLRLIRRSDGRERWCLCAGRLDGLHYWITEHEAALLVALYDKMGSGRLKPSQFLDSRIGMLDEAHDGLVYLNLVESCAVPGGGVDIALTDIGMEIANMVQDGFPRTSGLLDAETNLPALPSGDSIVRRLEEIQGALDKIIGMEFKPIVFDPPAQTFVAGIPSADPLPGRILSIELFDHPIPASEFDADQKPIALVPPSDLRPLSLLRAAWAKCRQALVATGKMLVRWLADSCR